MYGALYLLRLFSNPTGCGNWNLRLRFRFHWSYGSSWGLCPLDGGGGNLQCGSSRQGDFKILGCRCQLLLAHPIRQRRTIRFYVIETIADVF